MLQGFRPRRLAGEFPLVAAGLVAAMCLAEAAVRFLPRRWVPELSPVSPQRFYLKDVERLSSNARLLLELIPNNPRTQVNADGYRGTLYPEKKPAGVRRIVGLGDSSMYAFGVPEQLGYMRQLETLLSQASASPVEVVNLAVPGYNSDQELEVLRTRALRFDPDLIILGYDHNDSEASDLVTERATMPSEYGKNALHSELLRYFYRKFYYRVQFRRTLPDSRLGLYIYHGSNWDRHLEALSEFARLTGQEHVPVIVVVQEAQIRRDDTKEGDHYQRLHVPLVAFWHECGFYPVDCYDLFEEYMRVHDLDDMQNLWANVRWGDWHPNALAHRMIAEALLDKIREFHLLPMATN